MVNGKKYNCISKESVKPTWKWVSGKEPYTKLTELADGLKWEHWLRVAGQPVGGDWQSEKDGDYRPMRVEPDNDLGWKDGKVVDTYACASVHWSGTIRNPNSNMEWVENAKCDCKREQVCVKSKLSHKLYETLLTDSTIPLNFIPRLSCRVPVLSCRGG